jgi:transcriptional regulator with XRE-family HTH domain
MNYNELKKVAESKNFTIKRLAEEIGLSSNGLKRSIEGETMSIKTLRDLCDILQISIAEFFGEATMGNTEWMAAEPIPYNMSRQPSGEVQQLLARIAELKEDKAFLQAQVAALTGAATKKTKSA